MSAEEFVRWHRSTAILTTNETWSGRGRMANWLKRRQETLARTSIGIMI